MKKKNIAYDLIKNAIFECKFLPGEALDEKALAKLAGVSRTPLREALAALEKEGFVRIIPHRGAFVTEITADEVEQMFDVRIIILEAFAVHLATPNIPEGEIRDLLVRINNCSAEIHHNPAKTLEVDNHLHNMICHYCGNETLKGFLFTIAECIKRARIRSTYIQEPKRLEQSIQEHKDILNALMERNAKEAEKLMKKHIANAKIHALNALRMPMRKLNN